MHPFTQRFTSYCEEHFNLNESQAPGYRSLSICLIDCVYSLRAQYYAVTLPIVDRYAAAYMQGDRYRAGDTVSMLLQHIQEIGGAEAFAGQILKNHQKLGGTAHISKESVCLQLAQYLNLLNIDTPEDFRNFKSPELLEIVIRAVKGLGDAGTNYLFMLTGDPNRCKPDVHIYQCIKDACGSDISSEDCQTLFTDAVSILKSTYPHLTVRGLDGIIWRAYQIKK